MQVKDQGLHEARRGQEVNLKNLRFYVISTIEHMREKIAKDSKTCQNTERSRFVDLV